MDTLPDALPAQTSLPPTKASTKTINEILGDGGSFGIKVEDYPKFDLESYIANYVGRTRFNRLYLIGTTSTLLSADALKAAVIEAKSGKDVGLYEKAVRALAEVAPRDPDASLDSVWVQEVQRSVRAQTDRLEQELRGYKNNLIKESIRMGNEDLGNHYYETGNLIHASKAYSRMRDYCTTPGHIASMLFKLINVCADRGDWLSVQSHVFRLRNAQVKPEDAPKNQPKMAAALGLSQMHSGSYLEAAKTFISTDPSLGDTFNDMITPNDIAVYGGLCALASMSRNELQEQVLDNPTFRNFLELEPHIRRAIGFFCNSKFRPCLDILDAYRADYLLDIHLQRHFNELYKRIRRKAMQQYLVPFSRVTLESMATVFAPEAVGGEAKPFSIDSSFVQEILGLVLQGVLSARLDLERKVLVSRHTNLRTNVQTGALDGMRSFNGEAHVRVLHASVARSGLQLPAVPGFERKRRTGDGRHRGGAMMG